MGAWAEDAFGNDTACDCTGDITRTWGEFRTSGVVG